MKRTLITALAVLITGCVPVHYLKPGGSTNDFARDLTRCKYEARLATSGYGTSNTQYGRGAAQGVAEGIAQAIDMREITQMCLESNGWRAG